MTFALLLAACGGGEEPLNTHADQAMTQSASLAEANLAVTESDQLDGPPGAADDAEDGEGYEDLDTAIVDAVQEGLATELPDEDTPPSPLRERALALASSSSSTAALREPGPWHTRLDSGERVSSVSEQNALPLLGVPDYGWTPEAYEVDPGALSFTYQGGDSTERFARVINDPAQQGNQILKFWLRQANVRSSSGQRQKGRVQMNAADLRAREVRFSVRMYLHPDMALLRSMPEQMHWLTLSEWWNNADWARQGHPFRVSVNLTKAVKQAGSPLRFRLSAQTLNKAKNEWSTPIWQAINQSVDVPFGQWVTLDYYFREGNASQGRFFMTMQPDGGVRRVVFSVLGWTQHPADSTPDGLTHLNPLKLYAQKKAVDHVRNRGGALQVYWDDLSFRLCPVRKPLADSACSPSVLK